MSPPKSLSIDETKTESSAFETIIDLGNNTIRAGQEAEFLLLQWKEPLETIKTFLTNANEWKKDHTTLDSPSISLVTQAMDILSQLPKQEGAEKIKSIQQFFAILPNILRELTETNLPQQINEQIKGLTSIEDLAKRIDLDQVLPQNYRNKIEEMYDWIQGKANTNLNTISQLEKDAFLSIMKLLFNTISTISLKLNQLEITYSIKPDTLSSTFIFNKKPLLQLRVDLFTLYEKSLQNAGYQIGSGTCWRIYQAAALKQQIENTKKNIAQLKNETDELLIAESNLTKNAVMQLITNYCDEKIDPRFKERFMSTINHILKVADEQSPSQVLQNIIDGNQFNTILNNLISDDSIIGPPLKKSLEKVLLTKLKEPIKDIHERVIQVENNILDKEQSKYSNYSNHLNELEKQAAEIKPHDSDSLVETNDEASLEDLINRAYELMDQSIKLIQAIKPNNIVKLETTENFLQKFRNQMKDLFDKKIYKEYFDPETLAKPSTDVEFPWLQMLAKSFLNAELATKKLTNLKTLYDSPTAPMTTVIAPAQVNVTGKKIKKAGALVSETLVAVTDTIRAAKELKENYFNSEEINKLTLKESSFNYTIAALEILENFKKENPLYIQMDDTLKKYFIGAFNNLTPLDALKELTLVKIDDPVQKERLEKISTKIVKKFKPSFLNPLESLTTWQLISFEFSNLFELLNALSQLKEVFSLYTDDAKKAVLELIQRFNLLLQGVYLTISHLETNLYLKKNYLLAHPLKAFDDLVKQFHQTILDCGYEFKPEERYPYTYAIALSRKQTESKFQVADDKHTERNQLLPETANKVQASLSLQSMFDTCVNKRDKSFFFFERKCKQKLQRKIELFT